jgi:hypothetical protein
LPDPLQFEPIRQAYQEYGERFPEVVVDRDAYRVLPFELYLKKYRHWATARFHLYFAPFSIRSRKSLLSEYLEVIERDASRKYWEAVGFKLLPHHAMKWRDLWDVFKKRKYRALHLVRKNTVRQVLSGLIARARGVYNERNYKVPNEKYCVDISQFEKEIRIERFVLERSRKELIEADIEFLEVYYEDFLSDRLRFFEPILRFLDVEQRQLVESDYSRMVPNLQHTVLNYAELVRKTEELGVQDYLY